MKSLRIFARLSLFTLAISSLCACSDLEKLFSDSKKSEAGPPELAQKPTPKPTTLDFKMSPSCLFPQSTAPENIDVFAIDGQPWIDQIAQLASVGSESSVITINIDTPEPVALLLTAKETARWRIRTSPRTKLWGVYVSASEPQRVSGIITPTKFQEHYQIDGDSCGVYWAPEFQVHQLYEFSRQLFGKPYAALPKIVNGTVEVKSFALPAGTRENEIARNNAETSAVAASMPIAKMPAPQIIPPVAPMSISEALRAHVIRPGTPADLDRFKSRYRAVNQREMGKGFDEHIQMMSIYVITSDFTFPGDGNLAGANAAIFILENRVPYPSGDSEHSPVLDMNTGACMGRICSMLIRD